MTEKHFDRYFAEKPKIEYEFDQRKMGGRDRGIFRTLMSHGMAGKRCLDIGPGTGRWLQFMRSNGAVHLAAADISQEVLLHCEGICEQLQKADLSHEQLAFETSSFDIILSFEVLEHIVDPTNYIAELVRVARPGGMLLMSTPNLVSLISRIRMLFGLRPMSFALDPTHVRHYRQKEVRKVFAPHDLTPRFIPAQFSLNPLNRLSRWRIRSNRLTCRFDDSLLWQVLIPD